jgi:hypothetical protein
MVTHSILQSRFPVDIPHFPELLVSDAEFVRHLEFLSKQLIERKGVTANKDDNKSQTTLVASNKSTEEESPFIKALYSSVARVHNEQTMAADNIMLTENGDVTHVTSEDALVDLFYKLTEDVVDREHLKNAWKCDPLATLKIIFNARSIHLGKSNRVAAYKAMGWLYKRHPMTFLVNLPWIARPVIMKPKPKKEEKDGEKDAEKEKVVADDKSDKSEKFDDEDDFLLVVPPEGAAYDTMALDRTNGMAHGYWKDLLNMLALAAHDHLAPDQNPKEILNIKQHNMGKRSKEGSPRKKAKTHADLAEKNGRVWDQKKAKEIRYTKNQNQHAVVIGKLKTHAIYRTFHIAVARLFAGQLKRDLALLNSENEKDKFRISLAAKWAPSLKEFHDKNTWIASSIAEILFTHEEVCPKYTPKSDRETYLKHARMEYQFKVLSPLRKALDLVERHISAEKFEDIKYQKVPSLAMDRYSKLFLKKDEEHFNKYLDDVSSGKVTISGAVLLPSVMVSKVKRPGEGRPADSARNAQEQRVLDLQWKTLVQRIKDSGKIESSIAVCDVSGSMSYPLRDDQTTPMHAAIGLSLLLAEVCAAPFGGSMISFSEEPHVFKVGGPDDPRSFSEKIKYIMGTQWGMTTNFEAVFSKLILPMAIENKIKQEDMVKQVFVFSDMQFNSAENNAGRWMSSHKRIKKQYADAGYEMPTMIFWDLAAGDKGVPVKSNQPGTALVSGYSQGQMKVFLDGGGFDGEDEKDDNEEVVIDNDGNEVKVKKEKKEITPVMVMRKAISHDGYSMLRVVD